MKVAVLANDVTPDMGLPVAAPGLRAWGLARGLRAHGHDVTVFVDSRVAAEAWRGSVPPQPPTHGLVGHPRAISRYVVTHGVDALVMTNSNHIKRIEDIGDCKLVYDFFAPKMLELAEHAVRLTPEELDEALTSLAERKIMALQRSDAVIINGAKKVGYVEEWLGRAGVPSLPHAVVNMPVPPLPAAAPADGPVHAVVSGYIQPWSQPGAWVDAVLPLLDDGSLVLHLLVTRHWGSKAELAMPPALERLAAHPNVVRHGQLAFGDFRRLLARCHLSIDVFERNPERELAMVTRSVVALSCGLPVMHVGFTEVSDIIAEHGAGWIVEHDDGEAMAAVLREVVADPARLAQAREGAVRVAREVFEPAAATAPLHDLLETICR